MLRAAHGLERLSKGTVSGAAPSMQQAFVFQTPIMLRRSVRENLIYPPAFRGLGLSKADMQSEVEKWLDIIGLSQGADRPAPQLSGGEKQKLALARALMMRPKLLFLDEPSANLDGTSTREIEQILLCAREDGVRIILATHDLGQARRLAQDVVFLLNGRVHEAGPAETMLYSPQLPETKAFLKGDIVE